jgi:hypothetical protein
MPHKNADDSEELHHLDIPGRKEAKRIESEHIQAYKEKHGQRPRGNLKD